VEGRFRTLAGIDSNPEACEDFRRITKAPAACLDLFSREDYIAFHGKEPDESWREVEPSEIRAACGGECPDVVFLSPPCKGFSGLLPKKSAKSEKYQALNRLTVRGLWYTLEAFRDNLPGVIMLENVPRITTRGKDLLRQLRGMLEAYGYLHTAESHDCGEIGGLGQRRKRFLLMARQPDKVDALVYQPPKLPLKTIGDVIGPLAMPDAVECGPMHRLPRLKWRTWVRLALIPAGGDWRDLQKIAPDEFRLAHEPRGGGPWGVQKFDEASGTVTGSASVKGSNATSVGDPRIGSSPRCGAYRVVRWSDTAPTVVGAGRVSRSNGAAIVADARVGDKKIFNGAMRVQRFDKVGGTVTGGRAHGQAGCVADPRVEAFGGSPGLYGVNAWDGIAPTVTGGAKVSSSNCACAIADTRLPKAKFSGHAFKVSEWDKESGTVIGATSPGGGAIAIEDPRLGCKQRSGSYGVQGWESTSKTVSGAFDIHCGAGGVADPRAPEAFELPDMDSQPDPPPVIISIDNTWHRPLTTFELAMLQGFPQKLPDGSAFVLVGKSDTRWRERIGNAVPPPAGKAMAEQVLAALMQSSAGAWTLGTTAVWVAPIPQGNEDKQIEAIEVQEGY
jgi:site-specific DNA-cytosine methylase